MMRILFGAVLALIVAVPPLADLALAIALAVASYPPAIAFTVGIFTWPRIVRRLRKWWKGLTK
jgi:hypothetical protein